MIPDIEPSGFLPVGRYSCSLNEVRTRFVDSKSYAQSVTRRGIWSDFLDYLSALRSLTPVCAVWIAGSFISRKVNPNDIDIVLLLDGEELDARFPDMSVQAKNFLLASGRGHLGWAHLRIPLKVDTYTVTWRAFMNGNPNDNNRINYFSWRGYWDDFWQRCRSNQPSSLRRDSRPERGYLEVVLDGYGQ